MKKEIFIIFVVAPINAITHANLMSHLLGGYV